METKRLTAIDWLFEKITQNGEIRWRGTQYRELFKQAKAMEEDQIIASWENGFWEGFEDKFSENCGLQYYNKTYGTPVDKK